MDKALVSMLRYFEALDAYDIEAALKCFSEEVTFYHPPYGAAEEGRDGPRSFEWHVVSGREELRRLWEFRGKADSSHCISAFARNGDVCFVEGYVVVGDDTRAITFLSILKDNEAGEITTYQPYSIAPGRPIIGAQTIRLPADLARDEVRHP